MTSVGIWGSVVAVHSTQSAACLNKGRPARASMPDVDDKHHGLWWLTAWLCWLMPLMVSAWAGHHLLPENTHCYLSGQHCYSWEHTWWIYVNTMCGCVTPHNKTYTHRGPSGFWVKTLNFYSEGPKVDLWIDLYVDFSLHRLKPSLLPKIKRCNMKNISHPLLSLVLETPC
jgi:hypothetical protein